MKKNITIILLISLLFVLGMRGRYAPAFWRAVTGGIAYDQGTVAVSTAFNYAADTASDDDYLASIEGITAYNAGLVIWLNPANDNTGACTHS